MPALKPRTSLFLTAGLILLILALFVALVDVPAVLAQLRRANWRFSLAAGGALLLGLGFYALRWQLLLINRASYQDVFHAANIGHMTNILVPLRAGEAARIAAISRSPNITISSGTSSVAVERWLEQLMRLTALGGALVLGIGLEITLGTIFGGLATLAIALAVMIGLVKWRARVETLGSRWLGRLPRVTEAQAQGMLNGFLEGLSGVASARRMALAFFWSVLTWLCFLGFHYLALRALPTTFPAAQILAISFGSLGLAPPSAPTQPGIYHASIVAPLGLLGYSAAALTAYAVLLHALQMAVMIALGAWGVGRLGASSRSTLPADND
jgi:uncharacterized protein (TIRG00374 family)